jgi:hypothetical protein
MPKGIHFVFQIQKLIKYLMDEAHYLVTHFSRKIAIALEQAFFASASVCQLV